MRKVPFRQLKRYGCGMYCLANLFNETKFLNYIIEDVGQGVYELNKAMSVEVPELYIGSVFLTSSQMKIQNRLFDPSIFEVESNDMVFIDNGFRPILVTIAKPILHYILCLQVFSSDTIYVVDSLKEYISVYTSSELLLKYNVVGIDMLFQVEEKSMFGAQEQLITYFDKRHSPHLF